jgi:Dockerin type I domain/PEP-CTERM motif
MGHCIFSARAGSARCFTPAGSSRTRKFASFCVVLLLVTPVNTLAAQLTLQTNSSAAAPLVITPSSAAAQLLVSVVNSVSSDPPSERMIGWKIGLTIMPDASAHGTLQFAAGAMPSPYVFDGFFNSGAPYSISNGVFTALDQVFATDTGAQIPTAPGAKLQLVSFTPSLDALGTFGIYALPSNTLWLDSNPNGSPDNNRSFVNISGSGMVRIGSVLVNALGDLNRDGKVTTADIPAMLSAMADTHGYLAAKNLTSQQWIQLADTNHDGVVNNADVQSLISMVANKTTGTAQNQAMAAVVPEPSSFGIALIGLTALLTPHLCRRRLRFA